MDRELIAGRLRRRSFCVATAFVAVVLAAAPAARAQCALPHAFANGQTADATQVMANFNALVTCLVPAGSTNAIQYDSGGGVLGGVGPLADGELVVGSTGNPPQAQALAAGSGISITNGAGAVTIAATGTAGLNGLYRQVLSATPTAASTGLTNWLNQGSSTVADTSTGITITSPPSGGTVANISARYGTAPTPPYKINVLIGATRSSNNFSAVGIGWYNGTNRLQVIDFATFNSGANFIEVTQWNSATSFNATLFATPANGFSQPIWLQIADDGTNVSFAFSQDGANFLPVLLSAKSSGFLGATGYSNVIFIVNPRGATNTIGTLMSWTQL